MREVTPDVVAAAAAISHRMGQSRLTGPTRSFRQLRLQPVVEVADVMLAGHQHPAVAVGA